MTKKDAIRIFGGSVPRLAKALSVTRQAIYMWPDDLSQKRKDEVIGAALRTGYLTPEDIPPSVNSANS